MDPFFHFRFLPETADIQDLPKIPIPNLKASLGLGKYTNHATIVSLLTVPPYWVLYQNVKNGVEIFSSGTSLITPGLGGHSQVDEQ